MTDLKRVGRLSVKLDARDASRAEYKFSGEITLACFVRFIVVIIFHRADALRLSPLTCVRERNCIKKQRPDVIVIFVLLPLYFLSVLSAVAICCSYRFVYTTYVNSRGSCCANCDVSLQPSFAKHHIFCVISVNFLCLLHYQ